MHVLVIGLLDWLAVPVVQFVTIIALSVVFGSTMTEAPNER